MDEVMPYIKRKVHADCICHRTRKGAVKLCFWHAWQEQRIKQAVRQRFARTSSSEPQ